LRSSLGEELSTPSPQGAARLSPTAAGQNSFHLRANLARFGQLLTGPPLAKDLRSIHLGSAVMLSVVFRARAPSTFTTDHSAQKLPLAYSGYGAGWVFKVWSGALASGATGALAAGKLWPQPWPTPASQPTAPDRAITLVVGAVWSGLPQGRELQLARAQGATWDSRLFAGCFSAKLKTTARKKGLPF
jgi:hypothetical protein